MPFKLQACHHL